MYYPPNNPHTRYCEYWYQRDLANRVSKKASVEQMQALVQYSIISNAILDGFLTLIFGAATYFIWTLAPFLSLFWSILGIITFICLINCIDCICKLCNTKK